MRISAAILALVLGTVEPISTHADELISSDELKFEARFPSKPERQSGTQAFTSGVAQVIRYKSTGKGIRPAITVIVFPRAPFSDREIAAGLELSGARQVARLKGTALSRKDLKVNGVVGRETVISGQSQGRTFFYRAQTFYAGNRQYILSVAAGDLERVTTGSDNFFASFKPWE